MAIWTADFAVATEITVDVINLVLDRYLRALQAQLQYTARLGSIGSFSAELTDLSILDVEDTAPLGGVETDLEAKANFKLRLFGINLVNTNMLFTINNLEIDLTKTQGGSPKGLVIKNTPNFSLNMRFPNARFILGWLLNRMVAPLVTFGVWMAMRIIRKVEIPIWQLVDVFNILGISYASNSPLVTAQKTVLPKSLLIASDFNLTTTPFGRRNDLKHFIPAQTNLGAVVHENLLTATVQIAFLKGWVPSAFRVGKWKIYINSIAVAFEQDTIVASGSLKAKRGKCWCKVKVRIKFRAAVKPRVVDANTANPKIEFDYDANINAHISTSGMLVVLGVIMFAPVFLALTLSMSFLINILLNQFLPFSTSWSQSGLNLQIQANSVHFSGFVPFNMNFPLQLSGSGDYGLSKFTQFKLPGGGPQMTVGFTNESLSIQEDELRVAIELK